MNRGKRSGKFIYAQRVTLRASAKRRPFAMSSVLAGGQATKRSRCARNQVDLDRRRNGGDTPFYHEILVMVVLFDV
jgi:hypothetical protein